MARKGPYRTVSRHLPLVALIAATAFVEPGLALALTPALVLLALLASGVRPGEALIERLRERRVRARRLRPAAAIWPKLELVIRPARQVASAQAVRPPPCVV